MKSFVNVQVPTFPNKASKDKVCIEGMSLQDLALLKKTDPFLYFSIPAVKAATMLNKDDEVDTLFKTDGSMTVHRQKRISVECHSNVLLEQQMMEQTGGNYNYEGEESDDEDDIYSFLSSRERQNKSNASPGVSDFADFTIPTFTKKIDKEQVCTKDNLPAIKQNDPFMYYSIPAARKSVMFDDAISAAELESTKSHTVRRQSRISFECYPDELLQNLFGE